MNFRGFADDDHRDFRTEVPRNFIEEFGKTVWRLENNRGQLCRCDLLKPCGASSGFDGEEAVERKAVGRQGACRDGEDDGGDAGYDFRLNSGFDGFADEQKTGIGDAGHSGVGHKGDFFAGADAANEFGSASVFVEDVVAFEARGDFKFRAEDPGAPCVFAENGVGFFQNAQGAERDILQIADGGCDD